MMDAEKSYSARRLEETKQRRNTQPERLPAFISSDYDIKQILPDQPYQREPQQVIPDPYQPRSANQINENSSNQRSNRKKGVITLLS